MVLRIILGFECKRTDMREVLHLILEKKEEERKKEQQQHTHTHSQHQR